MSPVSDERRLILLPAVDVVEGRAVRLVQGQAGSETECGSALDAAMGWQRDGAEWIHLVDLDAAFGRGSNRELLAEVLNLTRLTGEEAAAPSNPAASPVALHGTDRGGLPAWAAPLAAFVVLSLLGAVFVLWRWSRESRSVPPAQRVCAKCGEAQASGNRFCGNCGTKMG